MICRLVAGPMAVESRGAWRALQGQSDTEIREAILRVFGEARYKDGRRLVWDWVQRLKAASEQAGKSGAPSATPSQVHQEKAP